jgi:hypothetical protein
VTQRFRTDDSRPSVSYGPAGPDADAWTLSINCEDDRVDILVDEDSMYDLWVEVRGVPWPGRNNETEDRLVPQLVHAANGPDAVLPTLASRCLTVRFGAAPTGGFEDLAPHPALRTGQLGRLIRAREAPESEAHMQARVADWVAALDGPLGPALSAGAALVEAWTERPDLAPAERVLAHLRRDEPARYAAALDAVRRADEALAAYVSPAVVAHALTLRLRRVR